MCGYKAKKINGIKYDEHRLIAKATQLGFNRVVHHINGDKRDNRPENLQIMTRSQHAKEHGLGTKIRPKSSPLVIMVNENIECRKCGVMKQKEKFVIDKTCRYGHTGTCKACKNQRRKETRKLQRNG